MQTDEKSCPFCAETIKRAAVICRFCNRSLPAISQADAARAEALANLRPDSKAQTATSKADTAPPTKKKGDLSGGQIFVGLVVSCLAIWFMASRDSAPKDTSTSTAPAITEHIAAAVQDSEDQARRAAANDAAASTEPDSNNVELTPKKVKSLSEGKFGQPVLAGEVVNTSGRTLSYLEATAEFAKKGKVVATGLDNSTDTLAPGATWRFEVMWPEAARGASGRIVSVKGIFK